MHADTSGCNFSESIAHSDGPSQTHLGVPRITVIFIQIKLMASSKWNSHNHMVS